MPHIPPVMHDPHVMHAPHHAWPPLPHPCHTHPHHTHPPTHTSAPLPCMPSAIHAPCHACPLPYMPPSPCHVCPLSCTSPAMHANQPCMPPVMHVPCHACPSAMHAPLPCMPLRHACPSAMHAPLPCMPPSVDRQTPVKTLDNFTTVFFHSLSLTVTCKYLHRKASTTLLLTVTCEYPYCSPQKGEYRRVENVEQLREMMATFYSRPVFNTNKAKQTVYTVPYHDGFGFGKYNVCD